MSQSDVVKFLDLIGISRFERNHNAISDAGRIAVKGLNQADASRSIPFAPGDKSFRVHHAGRVQFLGQGVIELCPTGQVACPQRHISDHVCVPPKKEQYANVIFLSSLVFGGKLGKAGCMRLEAFNGFAGSLPHATHVVQWGGAHVWKIGGKVFAIGGWNRADRAGGLGVSFKVTRLAFDVLGEQEGLRPAPYLGSRGMTWIQRTDDTTMSDADLCAYLEASYKLVGAGLTKKLRHELGLLD